IIHASTKRFPLALHDALPISEQVGVTLGNSFGTSKKIQVTYTPNQLETVKKVAEARKRGRAALTSAKHQVRPLTFDWESEMGDRSEEHTSELQSRENLVCRLL